MCPFTCNAIINTFVTKSLKKLVRENLSRCFVLLDGSDHDRFIGFYILSSFAILAQELAATERNGLPHLPASLQKSLESIVQELSITRPHTKESDPR